VKKKPSKASTRKVLPLSVWPRQIEKLSDRDFIRWVRAATGMSREESFANPRLTRDRLLAALRAMRRKARVRRAQDAPGPRRPRRKTS
jgi:hypothetical protein